MFDSMGVQDYRGFERLNVSLTPVTLVSGRNNAGKTALLEALALTAAGPQSAAFALSAIRSSRLDPYPGPSPQFETNPLQTLLHRHDTGRVAAFLAGTSTEGDYRTYWEVDSRSGFVGGSSSGSGASGNAAATFSHSVAVRSGLNDIQDYIFRSNIEVFSPQSSSIQPGSISVQTANVEWRLEPNGPVLKPFYYLSGRTRSSHADIAARFSAQRTARRSGIFEDVLSSIDPRVRGVSSEIREGQLVLHVDIGGPYLTPLPELGEGMTAVADFVGCILSIEKGIVLIDEIENGIHYSALSSLWRAIDQASRASGTQVVASTHSRECMEAAHRALGGDSSERFSLLRLLPGLEGKSPQVKVYRADNVGGALDLEMDVR